MTLRRASFIGLGVVAALLLTLAALWLARARLVAEFAQRYFDQHGVAAQVEIGALGFSGVTGRFALGPRGAPELAAERIELFFDPLRWKPYLVEVRLVNPVVRATVSEQGQVTLPSLQAWLDSLGRSNEKSPYVSDDLVIAVIGLKALLATPAGPMEINGAARIVHNMPEELSLSLKPGAFNWRGQRVTARTVTLDLSRTGALAVRLAGDFANDKAQGQGITLSLDMTGLRFSSDGRVEGEGAKVMFTADAIAAAGVTVAGLDGRFVVPTLRVAGNVLETPKLEGSVTARNVAAAGAQVSDMRFTWNTTGIRASAAEVTGEGDVALSANAMLPPALVKIIRAFPALAMEPPLAAAIGRNLGRFGVSLKAHGAYRDGKLNARLTAPLTLRASGGGVLQVPQLSLSGTPQALGGNLRASLSGGGLPPLNLAVSRFGWNGKTLTAATALDSQLDFAVLRGIKASVNGEAVYADGEFRFTQAACVAASLEALGPLARGIKGQICPAAAPLFRFGRDGWRFDAEAREATAFLPLANADLTGGAAMLSFNGTGGLSGAVTVKAAKLADKVVPARFNPEEGAGEIMLASNVWRGNFESHDGSGNRLGSVSFQHAMATAAGSAHVEAPLVFAEGKLQPERLSSMLAMLRQASGRAEFKGDFTWNSTGLLTHTGTLAVRDFSFLSPMGRATALDTTLNLTSLLPPVTAPGQQLKIGRIAWTIPFTNMALNFTFSPTSLKLEQFGTDFATGHVALAPFSLNPTAPVVSSTATLTSLSLEPLIAASNLSGKVSLIGKVSGIVPFTAGPEGFRIKDGKLKSDGPGRLELGRALWGDSAKAANAVQDFAYQALENLAFDSLAADLNSVDGGRLQIVFHIQGRSDPPRPQTADVAVSDIVNGTALLKPVPLPSGTPITLTLDASLNFDELLKSYGEAWSKSLSGLGAK
jgi:acyl CoA:acetate/3-ketoacid CoA transferase alpha subunit